MSRTNKNIKKSILVALIALLVVLVGSYAYVAAKNSYWPFPAKSSESQKTESTSGDKTPTNDTSDSNTTDPTSNSDKKPQPETPTEDPANESAKNSVGVGIASAGLVDTKVEVRSFITGVVEGTGTCTATFTKGSLVVTASSQAFIDVSTSQCGPIDIEHSKFSEQGTWSVIVSYESPTSIGKSDALEVSL